MSFPHIPKYVRIRDLYSALAASHVGYHNVQSGLPGTLKQKQEQSSALAASQVGCLGVRTNWADMGGQVARWSSQHDTDLP